MTEKKEAIQRRIASLCKWALQIDDDLDSFDSYTDDELVKMLRHVIAAQSIIEEVGMIADKREH